MKVSPIAAMVLLAAFSALSCANVDPVRRFPGMVADMDPIPTGAVYVVFDRAFGGGINQVSVDTVFHPRLNAVSLEFRHEFVTYRQFWDEPARRHFLTALERYNADFEERNLVNRQRQTRNVYGRVSGRLEWQTARFTAVHVSYPVIEIGYRFRETGQGSRPFFTTLMRSARSEEAHGSGLGQTESRQIRMSFTRAQAADLAGIFDQAFLMGLVRMHDAQEPPAATPLWDDFDEFYEFYDGRDT